MQPYNHGMSPLCNYVITDKFEDFFYIFRTKMKLEINQSQSHIAQCTRAHVQISLSVPAKLILKTY